MQNRVEKIKQFGHHHLSTFEIGKDKPGAYWKQLGWQLIHRGYCYQDTDHFNVIRLTEKAKPVLRGSETVMLAIPPVSLTKETTKQKKERTQRTSSTSYHPLFETLRTLRRALAEEEGKPPFMIFSDATLHDMVRIKPKNKEELLNVSGVGQHKLAHYGDAFLDALQNAPIAAEL